ncbi:efflux RND transporter permease subunit [Oscillatoria salina IIICB1]|nr:efflux RND transporter permease subunit [Oscillatoria salina]MBZ8178811.1 efflux RND transporter permease subunit [Oscillatoria salina IIICB1]
MLQQPPSTNSSSILGKKKATKPKNSIASVAIRRHIGTLMLTLAVIVVGVFFLFRLQVDLLPSITYPRIGLRMDAPGVSPEVAVEEITKPLEQGLSATEGAVQVFSQTREGRISLDLFFQPGGDIDQALNDATAAFNRVRGNLPDVVENSRLFKFDPSQLPVYEFAVKSTSLEPVALRVFADEELSRELLVVPGVASVNVSGGVTEEVRINLDLKRLQALGVSLQDVLDALEERNLDVAGGRLEGEDAEPLTRTIGRFQSVEEINNLTLEVPNSPLGRIYLRDVAEIVDGTEDQRIYVFLNSEPAVKVSVQKQPDANTIAVVDGVKKRIEELQESGLIPSDMELLVTLDESRFIENSVANVTTSGVVGTALAAFAVLLFLGSLRQTFIIVTAIPLATLMAIVLMQLFGLSINVFSLGGLALGVGIVVDNSIVMLENISAGIGNANNKLPSSLSSLNQEERSPRKRGKEEVISAAIASGSEVESALVASTATNLVAVLPFLLIGGFMSLLFNELILTISFAVAASLLIALTVVPMMASQLLGIRQGSGLSRFWVLREFNRRFEWMTKNYQRLLTGVVHYRLVAIALSFLILGGGSLWMVDQIPQEILPSINTGQANLFAQFPPGTTLETNRQVMEEVDNIITQQPETEYAFTSVGGFLFASITSENVLRSSSTISLKPGTDVEAFVERVTKELDKLNLVDIRLRLSPGEVRGIILTNSPIRGADVDIMLQGDKTETLQQAGRQILAALDEKATLARFRPDADPKQPEVQILPNWERLAEYNLTAEDIGDTLQTAILGTVPTELQRGTRLVDIRVQLDRTAMQRVSQLEQLPLFTDNNRLIRLGEVAKIAKGAAPGEIQRINQKEVFLIAGSLAEGASLSEAIAETNAILAEIELPPGVRILPSTAAESNQQVQDSLKVLGGLAAFLVFIVMAVQYNSLIDPLVIMFTVPLALAGGIFGLYITQTAIGATVLVGAVLLVGIVVNNAIVMVELANQIRDQYGVSCQTAILQAAPQRLRPILMTTITTVLGLFPLALGIGEGSEFLQPLGVVVFSGLSLATFLTLFIIPCFYVLLHGLFGSSKVSYSTTR